METLETTKERLNTFLASIKMSKNQFERKINAGSGWVSKLKDKISDDKLKDISENFPNLNLNWLQYGIGEMLINPSNVGNIININKNTGNNNAIGDNNNITNCDIEIIKTQAETISKQQDTISKLTEMLLNLSKK